jgi:hypothetical protein
MTVAIHDVPAIYSLSNTIKGNKFFSNSYFTTSFQVCIAKTERRYGHFCRFPFALAI